MSLSLPAVYTFHCAPGKHSRSCLMPSNAIKRRGCSARARVFNAAGMFADELITASVAECGRHNPAETAETCVIRSRSDQIRSDLQSGAKLHPSHDVDVPRNSDLLLLLVQSEERFTRLTWSEAPGAVAYR